MSIEMSHNMLPFSGIDLYLLVKLEEFLSLWETLISFKWVHGQAHLCKTSSKPESSILLVGTRERLGIAYSDLALVYMKANTSDGFNANKQQSWIIYQYSIWISYCKPLYQYGLYQQMAPQSREVSSQHKTRWSPWETELDSICSSESLMIS